MKSMRSIIDEEMKKEHELKGILCKKDVRIQELMGKLTRIEEEKNGAIQKLEDKKRELDSLWTNAGRKLEVLKAERDQCKEEMMSMNAELEQMVKEKDVLCKEVSKMKRVEVEVRRLQLKQDLERCDEQEEMEKRKKAAFYEMVGEAILNLEMNRK